MTNRLQKSLFFCVDFFLPRTIAAVPYHFAFKSLKKKFKKFNEATLWYRNSFRRGNFVFGVSDLDLSVLMSQKSTGENYHEIKNVLEEHKKLYPFLGETNFYISELIDELAPALNYYERMRDPELSRQLHNVDYDDLDTERGVFMLRMIYADKKHLNEMSFLRQKKWKGHFLDMDFTVPDEINLEIILERLFSTLKLEKDHEKLVTECIYFHLNNEINEQNIFKIKLPEFWKYIFPHRYIWFEYGKDDQFLPILGTKLEKICLRQLDWEVWGLMTQLPFLPDIKENLEVHLLRLAQVSKLLSPKSLMPFQVKKLLDVAKIFKT
jgi:hypothetical protein